LPNLAVKFEQVSYQVAGKQIIKNLNLEIIEGEFLVGIL